MQPIRFGTLYRIPERYASVVRENPKLGTRFYTELEQLARARDLANNLYIGAKYEHDTVISFRHGLVATGEIGASIIKNAMTRIGQVHRVGKETLDKAFDNAWAQATEMEADILSLE